ncbi:phosphotyrosine protein phosphatase [Gracilibacillus halophilus YIM-C55.5]|uniref:Tyrosine-protein phosphatase n=1 Tax=Gracilibacillus halophilus YIM-C55.5 TaxID=1308866 RepID=N4WCV9_9BACI|nr:CpsB/CapC family capsule biosynthesis tyrosine phosphatase [Gracilibacillus halophilus]ENH98098.1 phosphotyrosine protein phosphatase [Gracilibacillus halophilus YIM-C55.5]
MIDIHPYILPLHENGPNHMQGAVEIAREAERDGVHTIIAAPKYHPDTSEFLINDIHTTVDGLNAKLKEENIEVIILAAETIRLHGDLLEEVEQHHVTAIGSSESYVLIDVPNHQLPMYFSEVIYDMQLKQYKPVFIHPEKNSLFIEEPNAIYDFVKKGALVQISATSLLGKNGRKIQKFSRRLLEHQLVHFLGSGAKTPNDYALEKAYQYITKEFGAHQSEQLQLNVKNMLRGETVISDEPVRLRKKKLFGII